MDLQEPVFQSKVVCEVDKDACGTLSANLSLIGHKSNIINPSDILSIDYETLPKDVNVIFGGPPLPGIFSCWKDESGR